MKKVISFLLIAIILVFMITALAGCNDDSKAFPRIEYYNSHWTFDANNRQIKVIDGYVLNQGTSYEWVETETGYDLVLHFEKE